MVKKLKNEAFRKPRLNYLIVALAFILPLFLISLVPGATFNDCSIYGNCPPANTGSSGSINNTYNNITIINGSYWTTDTTQYGLNGTKEGFYNLQTNGTARLGQPLAFPPFHPPYDLEIGGNAIMGGNLTLQGSINNYDYIQTQSWFETGADENGISSFLGGRVLIDPTNTFADDNHSALQVSGDSNFNNNILNNVSILGLTSTTITGGAQAGVFHGSGYVNASDSNLPSGDDSFTQSFWFNTLDSGRTVLISYGIEYNNYGMSVVNIGFPSTGNIYWQRWSSDFGTSTNIADGNWHLVTLTFDNTTDNSTIWIDGIAEVSLVQSLNIILNGKLDIGSQYDLDSGSPFYYTGKIDEVSIWNRSLSSGEITSLYNSGLGTCGTSGSGLVAGYHLDGDYLDYSGNGNTGTPHGGVTFTPDAIAVCYAPSITQSIENITYDNGLKCNGVDCFTSDYSPFTNDTSTIFQKDTSQRVLLGGATDDGSSALQVNGEINLLNEYRMGLDYGGGIDFYNVGSSNTNSAYMALNSNTAYSLFGVYDYALGSPLGGSAFAQHEPGAYFAILQFGGALGNVNSGTAVIGTDWTNWDTTSALQVNGAYHGTDGTTTTYLNDGTYAINVNGNQVFTSGQIVDNSNVESIDPNYRILRDSSDNQAIDWNNGYLYKPGAFSAMTMDWHNSQLIYEDGGMNLHTQLDWSNPDYVLIPNNLNVSGNITQASGVAQAGKVICYLTDGSLGHCTSIVGITGGCTCAKN